MSDILDARLGSLGHIVVNCTTCGEPRRIEVTGEIATVKRRGWFGLRMNLRGQDMGTCYVKLQAHPDQHQCPMKVTLDGPSNGLRIVK
jgi:hypothetical protein